MKRISKMVFGINLIVSALVVLTCLQNESAIGGIFGTVWIMVALGALRAVDDVPDSQSVPVDDVEGSGVYVIKDIDVTGYYKIGRSRNARRRLKHFGVKLPFNWSLVYWIETVDPVELETKLHRALSHKRVRGEWFDLSPADIQYIESVIKSISAMGDAQHIYLNWN